MPHPVSGVIYVWQGGIEGGNAAGGCADREGDAFRKADGHHCLEAGGLSFPRQLRQQPEKMSIRRTFMWATGILKPSVRKRCSSPLDTDFPTPASGCGPWEPSAVTESCP